MANATANDGKMPLTEAEQLEKVQESWNIIRSKDYKDPQGARAVPNERLRIVFGVDNAFTTRDIMKKVAFKKYATELMMEASGVDNERLNGNWVNLRKRAIAFSQEYITHVGDRINLPDMVRYITLQISLFYLFPGEAITTGDNFNDIVSIGRRINELWIESKKPENGYPVWQQELDLQAALKRVTSRKIIEPQKSGWSPLNFLSSTYAIVQSAVFWWIAKLWGVLGHGMAKTADNSSTAKPTRLLDYAEPSIPVRNPMNLILPAYETMWRIVMKCFLEIRYRGAENGPDWSTTMKEYLEALKDPNGMQHRPIWKSSRNGVKPMDIVKEGLRLYPPTRRVHRDFNGTRYAANIEKCHRFDILAGEDPRIFCPERWQQVCNKERRKMENGVEGSQNQMKIEEEKLGFMPFADMCPAGSGKTKAFGFKMIALLVAVLCAGVGDEWKMKSSNITAEREEPLKSDREAYEELWLEKS